MYFFISGAMLLLLIIRKILQAGSGYTQNTFLIITNTFSAIHK